MNTRVRTALQAMKAPLNHDTNKVTSFFFATLLLLLFELYFLFLFLLYFRNLKGFFFFLFFYLVNDFFQFFKWLNMGLILQIFVT
jgi:hypothetical protein